MKFVTAKVSDLMLDGVKIEPEHRDGSLFAITFTDAAGKVIKISKDSYSEIKALVPAPPKTVKKFALKMSLHGVADINETFNTEYDATVRKNEIEKKFGYPEFTSEIKEAEVLVEE